MDDSVYVHKSYKSNAHKFEKIPLCCGIME
jgi:hypothetical protein